MTIRTSSAVQCILVLGVLGAGCNAILGIGDPRTEAVEGDAEVPNVESGVPSLNDAARDARTVLDTSAPRDCYLADQALDFSGLAAIRHLGACTPTQVAEFKTACLGTSSGTCNPYLDANFPCSRCIFGGLRVGGAVTTPAVISVSYTNIVNVLGCAAIFLDRPDCSVKLTRQAVCLTSACAQCASDADKVTCKQMASEGICKSTIDVACENAINSASAQWQTTCQGTNFEDSYFKVTNYLCGPG